MALEVIVSDNGACFFWNTAKLVKWAFGWSNDGLWATLIMLMASRLETGLNPANSQGPRWEGCGWTGKTVQKDQNPAWVCSTTFASLQVGPLPVTDKPG